MPPNIQKENVSLWKDIDPSQAGLVIPPVNQPPQLMTPIVFVFPLPPLTTVDGETDVSATTSFVTEIFQLMMILAELSALSNVPDLLNETTTELQPNHLNTSELQSTPETELPQTFHLNTTEAHNIETAEMSHVQLSTGESQNNPVTDLSPILSQTSESQNIPDLSLILSQTSESHNILVTELLPILSQTNESQNILVTELPPFQPN